MYDNIHHTPIFTKPSSGPLPNLVADAIRQAIRDGRLQPGEQLPSEPEFAGQMQVSRTTLRDAVRMLVSDGTLERRRGVGTFVADNSLVNIREGLETLVSTSDVIRAQGYEPGTIYSRRETVLAGERLGEVFGLAPESALVHFSRTRTANGVPVIHCEEYVSIALLEAVALDDPVFDRADWSLYQVIKNARQEIVSAVCKVVPVVADDLVAARLRVAPRHPLLLLRQTHYAAGQRPVLYCENYHNSSVIEFHVLRRP